ncbi:zinc finger MYM-type protein 1-like [Xenia sp. Carnegie-2017]|uniref:zinc finger MYM-type protein 1-like n=1 Tax=Xenia sp. Carnegie-2017 TaxID=2897299 RepID=UPI001F049B0A|nr:zinc finger MYM-type protein 1-like [Xenia sp. Carnegie-2017]
MWKTITEAVLYLSRQEIAFRGHDESSGSMNRGNYREIIEDEIVKEIDCCTFLSIQVDEATDVSTKEQLSVIVRMDKGESVIVRQLGFVDVSCDRTATAISSVVRGKLSQYNNVKEKFIGQTYDGASVMSGHLNGVQAQVQQDYPYAQFVHCAAHRLNLVLCQAASSISPTSENLTDNPIGWDDETLKNLKQSSIRYSILQDKDTDFHYGVSRVERFKAFVASLRNDTEYCQVYDLTVKKVGPPVTSIPEVVKLLKINGVLLITSASVERSFSCLKRVKNYLRNTMSQGRFSSLCRISIHKDILSEKEDANTLHDEVVKKFIEKPGRLAFL